MQNKKANKQRRMLWNGKIDVGNSSMSKTAKKVIFYKMASLTDQRENSKNRQQNNVSKKN